ncbi:hypothetical protein E2C01_101841 [Portunus trituberculatus]|uniref:Uncharacterized protein n=1 Tax=Portunus trituberculatus TaxID=210409 RepID=A0A5B7KFU7_PORTR|nr:hypothetical protein [Portunus trituberculatus]
MQAAQETPKPYHPEAACCRTW